VIYTGICIVNVENENKFVLKIRRARFGITADFSVFSSIFLTSHCISIILMLNKLHA